VTVMVRVGGPNPQQIRALTSADIVTVAPSGDMARKALHDRNATIIVRDWAGTLAAGEAVTTKWTYTVPTGKIAFCNPFFVLIRGAVATELTTVQGRLVVTIGATDYDLAWVMSYFATKTITKDARISDHANFSPETMQTIQIQLYLIAGQSVKAITKNEDSVGHFCRICAGFVEFDA